MAKSDRVRYNLNLPPGEYARLRELAARRDTTILDLIRRAIRLLLLLSETADQTIILRDGDKDREITFL
jgi:hypothetical protein